MPKILLGAFDANSRYYWRLLLLLLLLSSSSSSSAVLLSAGLLSAFPTFPSPARVERPPAAQPTTVSSGLLVLPPHRSALPAPTTTVPTTVPPTTYDLPDYRTSSPPTPPTWLPPARVGPSLSSAASLPPHPGFQRRASAWTLTVLLHLSRNLSASSVASQHLTEFPAENVRFHVADRRARSPPECCFEVSRYDAPRLCFPFCMSHSEPGFRSTNSRGASHHSHQR